MAVSLSDGGVDRDVLLESFRTARAEIAARIQLRDKTLAAYLAGVISVVAFSLSQSTRLVGVHAPDLLLFLPALAFAAAKVIADNHKIVGALALYQALELGPFLGPPSLPLWERSEFLLTPEPALPWRARRQATPPAERAERKSRMPLIDEVAITDTIAIVGPAVAALVLYAVTDHGWEAIRHWPGAIGFGSGVILLLWSIALLLRAGVRRKRNRERLLLHE